MLTAIVDGIKTISLDLAADQWVELQSENHRARGELIACARCGGRAHTRKLPAPYLTQTFVHNAGFAAACHGWGSGESPDHDHLKEVIYRAVAKTKGWIPDAETMFDGEAKFDVLATKIEDRTRSGRRGFEVQLSSETAGEVMDRQARRDKHAAFSVWFVREIPSWSRLVPSAKVQPISGVEMVTAGLYRWAGGLDGGFAPPLDPPTLTNMTKLILRDRVAFEPNFGLIDLTTPALRKPSQPREDAVGGRYAKLECERPTPPVDLFLPDTAPAIQPGHCSICGRGFDEPHVRGHR